MTEIDTGLTSWQRNSNHNRMMDLQRKPLIARSSTIELAYFGSSAFRLTSPQGISIMIDPWRNHPCRQWDWYFNDFPTVRVDIGVSTHAHFDHDALHRLDANVLLDRLIGSYHFGDVIITGIADKHATDSSAAQYDFKKILKEFDGVDITPPNNPRSWDNCLIVVEIDGLRLLHWGDNRHNPAEDVWAALGHIDVLLVPVDNSQHVLSHDAVDGIVQRLKPTITVPHHYYIWDLVQRQSTLLPATDWLDRHTSNVTYTDTAAFHFDQTTLETCSGILYFGDHVQFDKYRWRAEIA